MAAKNLIRRPYRPIFEDELRDHRESTHETGDFEMAVEEQVIDEQVMDEQVMDEQVMDEQVTDELVTDEQIMDEQVVHEPVIAEQVIDEQGNEAQSMEEEKPNEEKKQQEIGHESPKPSTSNKRALEAPLPHEVPPCKKQALDHNGNEEMSPNRSQCPLYFIFGEHLNMLDVLAEDDLD